MSRNIPKEIPIHYFRHIVWHCISDCIVFYVKCCAKAMKNTNQ